MRIGWFATGGHTEVGGLQRFLERIDGGPRWVRCLPAVQKPGPKLGRVAPAPADEGITGADLRARMMATLRRHRAGEFDAYLLVDDADCRLCGDDPAAARTAYAERLAHDVARRLGRDVPVVVLLASPESEAWFVADWPRGFRAAYPRQAVALGRAVNRLLKKHGLDRDRIEAFGCPRAGTSCTTKLSDELTALVEARGGRYSKGIDGPSMLRRVEPDQVARRCRRDFAPALAELRRLLAAHAEQT